MVVDGNAKGYCSLNKFTDVKQYIVGILKQMPVERLRRA